MLFIRQNATHKVVVGPAVAVGDGYTPVTNLDVSTADEAEAILHDNGTVVDISGYTWAAITTADGYYHLTLQSGISGTVGHLTIVVNDDSLCLPVKAEFTVIEEAAYDAMYASGALGPVTLSTTAVSNLEDAFDTTGYGFTNCTMPTTTAVTNGVTLAAGAVTDASLAGNMEIVFETDFGTNYNATRNAWATNAQDFVGTTASDPFNGQVVAASVTAEVDADVTAISGSATAANNLEASTLGIVSTTVNDASASTTSFVITSAEDTNDHFKGRIIVFTTGNLANQATDITGYNGTTKAVTVTALTEAPGNGDAFVIV